MALYNFPLSVKVALCNYLKTTNTILESNHVVLVRLFDSEILRHEVSLNTRIEQLLDSDMQDVIWVAYLKAHIRDSQAKLAAAQNVKALLLNLKNT